MTLRPALRAIAFAASFAIPIAVSAALPGDPATDIRDLRDATVLTLDGRERTLADYLDGSALVVAYTGVGCPISSKYAPRLSRLSEQFADKHVRFLGINASPQDTREAIAKECEELGLGFEVVKDFRQELTRRLDAKTTTEVFLFDAGGILRYRGAVDDQYTLGASRPRPVHNFLADALAAVTAGEAPPEATTAAPGCLLTRLPEAELPEAVTWSRDIAPIIQENCEVCHRPGQVGPFALQTYEQARGWAEMIGSVVEEGRMPPWNADEEFRGIFTNERRLEDGEKAKLLRWIADGMPRGNPDEDPEPKTWFEGWTIGEPDVVFSMERRWAAGGEPADALPEAGFEVPREGVVDYQYFEVQTDFPEDRWIQAIETRPGAADVVHHVLILLEDPKTGARTDFRSYLAVAVPGDTSTTYPEGYGKRLPAGANLVFQIHYTPNGKQRFDRSSVAMIFCDETPLLEVVTDAILNRGFKIPPGAENYEVRQVHTFAEETAVIALFPHMHTRGKDFRYVAHYPDGESEDLLFSHYDFNWQEAYVFGDPMVLPRGTRLEVIGHFDNSADNPNNPDPEAWVTWGDQTFEEMFIGYFDWVRFIE